MERDGDALVYGPDGRAKSPSAKSVEAESPHRHFRLRPTPTLDTIRMDEILTHIRHDLPMTGYTRDERVFRAHAAEELEWIKRVGVMPQWHLDVDVVDRNPPPPPSI